MSQCGTGNTHCCWLGKYGECQYVKPVDNPPFKWACTLRAELGSWEAAHADQRYLQHVKPKLTENGITVDCGDWPTAVPTARCADCGYSSIPPSGG